MKTKPKKITTIRISEITLARFDACAARRGVSRNLLLQQLMDQFVRKDRSREKEGVL
jgi:metal-responsive CopG/Arc/MetJ family transcriptional regulator